MPLTNAELASVLEDETKCVRHDITWFKDEDRSSASEFRAKVETHRGWPPFVKGRYNPDAGSLTYALILKTVGRIYGLDMGKDHHNPQREQVWKKHKHRWSEQYADKQSYVPDDVTAPVSDLVAVWKQFCIEASIRHDGEIRRCRPFRRSCGDGCQPNVPRDSAGTRSFVHLFGAGRLSTHSDALTLSGWRQH